MPTFNGTAGNNTINGDQVAGDLDDIINGLAGNDRLRGLFGDDQLFGDAGDDRLEGGEGDDDLDGGAGQDRLDGGAGDDELTGGTGSDTLDGGGGFDRAYYSGSIAGYQISPGQRATIRDLVPGDGNDGADSLRGVERAVFDDGVVLLIPNEGPDAQADAYATDEDVPLVVAAPGVLANDSDFEGDPLSAVLATGPANGTLVFSSDGSFTYNPNPDFNGTDSFTYFANDGFDDGNTVTVTLTVDPVNDAPDGDPDVYSTDEDTPLVVAAAGVLANDTDVDGDPLTAALVAGPAHGTLVFSSDGSFTYTPNENYNGIDSFTYRGSDGTDDTSIVTVTLNIAPVNDAPVAVGESLSLDEDDGLLVLAPGLLSNDTDAEGDPLTAVPVSGPAHGLLLSFGADGSFVYTPDEDYNGPDSFSYLVSDGTDGSNTVTVNLTINPVNDPPEGVDDGYIIEQDTALVTTEGVDDVLGNDSDIEGDPLTAVLVTGPAEGTLVFNSDGSFTYTPNAGFTGIDTFTYMPNDGTDDGNVVNVDIFVVAAFAAFGFGDLSGPPALDGPCMIV